MHYTTFSVGYVTGFVRSIRKPRKVAGSVFIALAIMLAFAACEPGDVKRARSMTINDVDLSTVADGVRKGAYTIVNDTFEVETTVAAHKIVRIDLVRTVDASYAKKAAAVIPRIIERQTLNVDAVTGATASSKAILKAVERSLAQ